MKEWYDAGAGTGREGIGLGKTGTAPGEDMERFGATYYLFCLASAASNSAIAASNSAIREAW